MAKMKDMQFFMENLKINRKKDKKFDLPQRGFEPQIFSNFLAHEFEFSWKVTRSNQNKLLELDVTCHTQSKPRWKRWRSHWVASKMAKVCTWFVANPTSESEQHEIERVRKGLQSRYHWQPSWQSEYYWRSEGIWLLLQSTKLTHFHTLWLLLPLHKSESWMSLLLKKEKYYQLKPSLGCTFHPNDLNSSLQMKINEKGLQGFVVKLLNFFTFNSASSEAFEK